SASLNRPPSSPDLAHLGTTTGSRLCPKDQPQQVRMPRVAELSENARPRRAAAAGAPHTAAVRSRAFGGGIKMRPSRQQLEIFACVLRPLSLTIALIQIFRGTSVAGCPMPNWRTDLAFAKTKRVSL